MHWNEKGKGQQLSYGNGDDDEHEDEEKNVVVDEEDEDEDVDDDAEARCKCTNSTVYYLRLKAASSVKADDAQSCLEAALGKVDALVDDDDGDLVALQSFTVIQNDDDNLGVVMMLVIVKAGKRILDSSKQAAPRHAGVPTAAACPLYGPFLLRFWHISEVSLYRVHFWRILQNFLMHF